MTDATEPSAEADLAALLRILRNGEPPDNGYYVSTSQYGWNDYGHVTIDGTNHNVSPEDVATFCRLLDIEVGEIAYSNHGAAS